MAPITVDAMVERALTRVHEVTDTYPSTRGPMYRRTGQRQRELYVIAAQLNADYYGRSVAVSAAGPVDLSTLSDPPELLQRVEIADPGSSAYAAGDDVAIVSLTDPAGELAPRVMLRQLQLIPVGTDLAGVNTLTLWYAHLPAAILVSDAGTTLLSLDDPWDALLELDLAQWVLGKATAIPAATRELAIKQFAGEEAALLGKFTAHLKTVAPTIQRFLSPLTRPNPVL